MFRAQLIAGAPLGGLLLGALAWLALGRGQVLERQIADLQDRASSLSAPAYIDRHASVGSVSTSNPIFNLTTGVGAVSDTILELSGIARGPNHTAALISINGKPPTWMNLGETRDDVTLDDVQADKVVVDTPTGSKEVVLGAKPPPTPSSGAAQPTSASSGLPPGVKLPPAPASAPGT